ncbi:acetate--CoA ligase [Vicingus serpentipes]|uniref:Acetate--CoA ligase n=2 Tax=Vicingus serpentipes TaxID=1926625 RepID=A0A5C6RP01_9FLAO|nr:acetate--CoA ligase [Vicingus serpentipes]
MSLKISSFEEYQSEYNRSINNPNEFWAEKAKHFYWREQWDSVLEWDFKEPNVKWFVNGKLNITENCLDRHLETIGGKVAIIWEPNNPNEEVVKLTYRQLHEQVCKFANVLKNNGAKKGDRICIYMPMVPELAIATLACARIGAIHSVVFAGFSAKALAERINDATCNIILTSDEGYRGSKTIAIKSIVDEALESCDSIQKSIVLKRTGGDVSMQPKRDVWLHEEMLKVDETCNAEEMDAEDELFVLYTSGSTGKPKGIVHTTGGYMVYTAYSFQNVFQYSNDEVYWCTADIGWITGHSYIVYGPLLSGATTLMFEGVPTYPDAGRFWEIVDKHQVNIFYTAPTAIRALEACDIDFVNKHSLSSLKVLGSVGEPINEEAWEWYHKNIGKEKCPIVDTWWQTETGGIMISPLAGITKLKPSFATLPLPGIQPCLVDSDGNEIEGNDVEGNLCVKFPWPSMLRTIYGEHERCKQTYFSTYKGKYFTGDGCKRDENGMYRITGRVDDVINVSGHRMGTAEVEDALDQHIDVVESAVVGYPHDIKGQGIYAYVICVKEVNEDELRKELLEIVTKEIGPIAKPDKIQIVKGLPKTRSGKIMRRILRKIAEGDTSNLGDISTLLDPDIVKEIQKGAENI